MTPMDRIRIIKTMAASPQTLRKSKKIPHRRRVVMLRFRLQKLICSIHWLKELRHTGSAAMINREA